MTSSSFIDRCATQWPAVRTRSGATSVPPQPAIDANHGTDSGATGWPPTTAPAGAAATITQVTAIPRTVPFT
jgi:hypothetical protein